MLKGKSKSKGRGFERKGRKGFKREDAKGVLPGREYGVLC
jgi:hypothetical protein